MVNIRRILVATDFSEVSARLYAVAADMARPTNADLIFAHIADFHRYVETLRDAQVGVADYLEGLRSKIRQDLRSADLPDGLVRVEVMLQQSTVSEDIRALARRFDVNLIVMGTHGRTGISRALLGSVAEDVIRHAAVPVLTVPVAARPERRLASIATTRVKEGASNV